LPRPLDRIDFDILAALQNDGRLSNKELAASVGLAPSSCLERVRALREAGVLRGFRAEVDPKAVGVGLQAMIAIRLRLHDRQLYAAFKEHVLAMPEVVAAFYLSGADDFLLHVAVRDVEHLREIAVDRLASRAEVGHMETHVIFEHTGTRPLPIYR
jgi:DNA-binding Lrp family transcriptional regulator